jgi:hypothetical protein
VPPKSRSRWPRTGSTRAAGCWGGQVPLQREPPGTGRGPRAPALRRRGASPERARGGRGQPRGPSKSLATRSTSRDHRISESTSGSPSRP